MSEQPLWQPSAIRLFDADGTGPPKSSPNRHGLSADMSLVDFAEAFVFPVWMAERNDQPATIKEYRCSLGKWRELTDDPPLWQIDDYITCRFVAGLFQLPGREGEKMSRATVRKHVRQAQTCLDLAGPKCAKHRKAQGLVLEVPWIEPPSVDHAPPEDVFTLDEIGRMLTRGCSAAELPEWPGVKPADWWHSLIEVAYNTGERRNALLTVEFGNLTGGTLLFPSSIRKGKVKSNAVPLNEWALAAIERIRTDDRKTIFPWPFWPSPSSSTALHRNWKKLLKRADIPPERQFGLHGLRKAGATECAEINPLAAQQMMGHADFKTTQKHYINRKVLGATLSVLPQPKQSRGRHDAPNQQRLFEV